MNSQATLVLSTHRPETVLPAQRLMERHDAVILEEPPDHRFSLMLSGELSIDDYLEDLDLEYPEFGQRMSATLCDLYSAGKRLYQVEPFLETLLWVHDLFAEGGGPEDLKAGTDPYRVHAAERDATAALLDYYRISVRGTFEETIDAVKGFARADARRFLLRDRMRADAIVKVLIHPGAYYIEAGHIHYALWRELKRRLPVTYPLTLKFLMADAMREMGYRGHLYGPGDLLTLLYLFHPDRSCAEEDHLAARALIYIKLIAKEEMVDTTDPYPHSRDELECGALVRNLSLEDCRRLFSVIRREPTDIARARFQHYLKKQRIPNH
jgi:hypothetical protein